MMNFARTNFITHKFVDGVKRRAMDEYIEILRSIWKTDRPGKLQDMLLLAFKITTISNHYLILVS